MMFLSLNTPLGIIVVGIIILVVLYYVISSISSSYLYTTNPPFLEQRATYEFRNKIKQPFYTQDV